MSTNHRSQPANKRDPFFRPFNPTRMAQDPVIVPGARIAAPATVRPMGTLGRPPETLGRAPSAANPYTTYTVRRGQRLTDIAKLHGVTTGAILQANPNKARVTLSGGGVVFAQLNPGDRINIPATRNLLSGAGTLAAPTGSECSDDSECDSGNCVFGYCAPSFGGGGGGDTTNASGGGNSGGGSSGGGTTTGTTNPSDPAFCANLPPNNDPRGATNGCYACQKSGGVYDWLTGGCYSKAAAEKQYQKAELDCAYQPGKVWNARVRKCVTGDENIQIEAKAGNASCGVHSSMKTDSSGYMSCQCDPGYDWTSATGLDCGPKAGGGGGGGTVKPKPPTTNAPPVTTNALTGKLSTGAKVAIGVAAVAGLAAVVAGGTYLYKKNHKGAKARTGNPLARVRKSVSARNVPAALAAAEAADVKAKVQPAGKTRGVDIIFSGEESAVLSLLQRHFGMDREDAEAALA